LLPLFSLLPSFASFPIFTYILYITIDLLSANALIAIAESGEAGSSVLFTSPRRDKRWSGFVVATL
jgi:phosphatidylinositol glycan class U